MTTLEPRTLPIEADSGVYAPQHDTWMLCDALITADIAGGARVLDMCTGSGAVAIAAAHAGAREVVAFDLSERAVNCADRNSLAAGVEVDVRLGSFTEALALPRFDVLLCNPPYVPSPTVPNGTGLERAWDGGLDGRIVLDQLCTHAHRLLAPGGVLLLVQSDCSGPDRTVEMLSENGCRAGVVAKDQHRFGPVMQARSKWLAEHGRIEPGTDTETLVVVRADRPDVTGPH